MTSVFAGRQPRQLGVFPFTASRSDYVHRQRVATQSCNGYACNATNTACLTSCTTNAE